MSDWQKQAACRGAPDEDVRAAFGTGGQQRKFARRHCDRCWVKEECFTFGQDEWGVWGGTTEKQRGNLLGSRRERTATPRQATASRECGSPYAYQAHRLNGEEPCRPCKTAWSEYCQERKRIRLGRMA